VVALIGFHFTLTISLITLDRRADNLSSSWSVVEYRSQLTSAVFSLSEALGQRLKSLFSKEDLAYSIRVTKGIDWARTILHQLRPPSSLAESLKKYFSIA
jgi:hypothetical protein